MLEVIVSCTADASAGTFPSTVLSTSGEAGGEANYAGWFLMRIALDPGATGPTNGAWDYVLTDEMSFAITAGELDNRSATVSSEKEFSPVKPITGTLTQTVTDAAVNSATFTAKLVLVK